MPGGRTPHRRTSADRPQVAPGQARLFDCSRFGAWGSGGGPGPFRPGEAYGLGIRGRGSDNGRRACRQLAQANFALGERSNGGELTGRLGAPIFAQADMVTMRVQTLSVDRMFRAFSDRTRLRCLHLLGGGELCVCDIVRVLGLPQPKVSRHLAYLRKAGLVVARREGLWMHYALAPARTAFHRSLLDCLGQCFDNVPELAGDRQRLKAAPKCSARSCVAG